MQITINPNPNPVADAERVARVAQPGFGKYFTDNMFIAEWNEEKGWHDARLTAYASLTLDPATMVFHYGQEIFEGMKAYRQPDGAISLFRPEANAERFARSAARIALPELPVKDFVAAVEALVKADAGWVPNNPGESLYIRPFMIASEVGLGVRPSSKATFLIIATVSKESRVMPGSRVPVSDGVTMRAFLPFPLTKKRFMPPISSIHLRSTASSQTT